MRLSPLLTLSLVTNVALLTAFVLVPSGSPPPGAASHAKVPAARTKLEPATSSLSTNTSATAGPAQKPWARLSTEDIPSLVARLCAAGFPNSLLRALIAQRFELRREEITHDDLDRPYWKNPVEVKPDPKIDAELAQLKKEQTAAMEQLFGPGNEFDDENDERRIMRSRMYGDLPNEKISRVLAVQRSQAERLNLLYEASRGGAPLDMEKMNLIGREEHAEIARLLSPAELLEFDLRSGATASRLRAALTGFNPTEAEYRALFPLYQAFDVQFAPLYVSKNPQDLGALGTAQQQMQEQARALLSPERYADYLQSSRPEYQQLNQLVTRLDLPLSAAAQVVTVQQDIQSRANVIRTNADLAAADRTAQLAALANEASAKITAAIGARGLEGYKQSGGQWLDTLNPRPRANAKKP